GVETRDTSSRKAKRRKNDEGQIRKQQSADAAQLLQKLPDQPTLENEIRQLCALRKGHVFVSNVIEQRYGDRMVGLVRETYRRFIVSNREQAEVSAASKDSSTADTAVNVLPLNQNVNANSRCFAAEP